ncbi:MAG: outer membrane lipoprotein carrier protein LolA [Bacillus sp. (in: firmicutes)]
MRKLLLLITSVMIVFSLAACGQKSQEDVVQSLSKKVEQMKSYKAKATMTMKMGSDPQVYDVEIWYKNPDFYRVLLKNDKKEQSQMILRNKEGVYVLTPALNKSFHFQSDWPNKSSQAYLYDSIVKDILEDKESTFKATEDHYVFETKTRYQNSRMLPYQEVTFKKKDLKPVSVKILDPDKNVLVTVDFSEVVFDHSFDKDAFDMKKNMTGAQLEVPVMADLDEKEVSIKYPAEFENVSLVEEKEVKTENGKSIVMTYEGDMNFTLIAEQAEVLETSISPQSMMGEPVDLGFTIGAMTDKSITWTYEGVDYTLASSELDSEQLLEIAQSVQTNPEK